MDRKQIAIIGALILVGATQPARAGFEFTPAAQAPAERMDTSEDMNAPMPIVPADPVTSEPLDGIAPVKSDQVLKLPSNYQADQAVAAADPVYVRRQRGIVMKAPKNQPMDTEALLKATENSEMVTLEGAPRPNKAAEANSGRLVINPYPLNDAGGATHGGGMGSLATEQALMEQGGNLRTIAVPGKKAPGMIARAQISSRYDSSSQYMDRTPRETDAAIFGISSSMTPIPGGEGAPLTQVAAVPTLAPRAPDAVSAMPKPAVPEYYPAPAVEQQASAAPTSAGGYTEAVGFGRDLPLALALSQVVPPEYSYKFAQNVNVGSTVSWQGGKPWNEVLNEMLASQGMRAVISGNEITILSAGTAA